jgi:hypothetical protein
MAKDDREVFQHLCAVSEDLSEEIAFLTYAIYAREKYEWFARRTDETGTAPSLTDVNRWIADITESRYVSMRERAAQLFDAASWQYLRPKIEVDREDFLRKSILTEVRAAGALWRQLFFSVVAAILTPLILGVVIVAALTYEKVMPTAGEVSQMLRQHQENVR